MHNAKLFIGKNACYCLLLTFIQLIPELNVRFVAELLISSIEVLCSCSNKLYSGLLFPSLQYFFMILLCVYQVQVIPTPLSSIQSGKSEQQTELSVLTIKI
jgi:hypothetical protein